MFHTFSYHNRLTYFRRFVTSLLILSLAIWGALFASLPAGGGVNAALAVGGNSGAFTHTTESDFTTACAVMGDSIPNPVFTDVATTNVVDGEIRMMATLEDEFNGTEVDTNLWTQGQVYPWYPVPPVVAGGVLTLDGSWLRSVRNFNNPNLAPRFFEARAIKGVFVEGASQAAADLGFYRELPPSDPLAPTAETAYRLFIYTAEYNEFARAADGLTTSPNNVLNPQVDLSQYHNFRIEWDAGADQPTRFYVDGALQATINGVSNLNTYVLLYHQDPSISGTTYRVMQVDWVRAGQYPATGSYESCVQDAGGMANFSVMNVTSSVPSGAGLVVETRTMADTTGATWSPWTPISGNQVNSPSGRYFQYRLVYSGNQMNTAEVQSVGVNYYGPSELVVNPNSVTLDPGATQQFTVTAEDANGDPVTGLEYAWNLAAGGGTLSPTGLFTAGLPAGTFTDTVEVSTPMATGPALTDSATVTVRNLPPVFEPFGSFSGPEGSPIQLTATATDPNGGPVSDYAWNLDANPDYETSGQTVNFTRNDNGTVTVGVRALDAQGNPGTATVDVTFTNVAPTITAVSATPSTLNEGASSTIVVTATDPAGPSDPLQYSFDCTNDGTFDIGPQALPSASCVYGDNGTFTVRVRVTDGDGGEDIDTSASVTVNNVAPTITNVTTVSPVNEGAGSLITVTASDPADPLQYSFDCTNDGTIDIGPQAGNSASCVYGDNGTYTVRVVVADGDGGEDFDTSATVVVNNVAPNITNVTNNGPIGEGSSATITVTAVDPGTEDILLYEFDCDNDGTYDVLPQAGNSAACAFAQDGSYTVGVRVTDGDGGVDTDTENVLVANVAPVIVSVTTGGVRIIDYPVLVTITATDPGVNDVLSYEFDCEGDDTYEFTGSTNQATCTYGVEGTYTIQVRVLDDDTATPGSVEVVINPPLYIYLPFILRNP
jgi:hypothetical protein